ncbi:hypothetical protein ACFLVY_01785 [Chloroflexota bacterium]
MEIGITLTIIFVVLRLVGVIDWSWLWIFSPLWIGAAIMGIIFAVAGAGSFFLSRRERKTQLNNDEGYIQHTSQMAATEFVETSLAAKTTRIQQSNAFGTWSLILGIAGFFLWGVVLGIIAVVLGAVQWRRHVSKRSIAGFTLGIVDIVLAVFWYTTGLMPSIF